MGMLFFFLLSSLSMPIVIISVFQLVRGVFGNFGTRVLCFGSCQLCQMDSQIELQFSLLMAINTSFQQQQNNVLQSHLQNSTILVILKPRQHQRSVRALGLFKGCMPIDQVHEHNNDLVKGSGRAVDIQKIGLLTFGASYERIGFGKATCGCQDVVITPTLGHLYQCNVTPSFQL